MIKRTHLAIGLSLGLYFLPLVTHKIFFIPIILIASVLPDIDSMSSNIGRWKILRPIQVFFEHRGPLHSYTAAVLFSIILTFFIPSFSLPFFLGYSFHLFADSFTVRGIRPFWPFKFHTEGSIRSGKLIDKVVFYTFVIIDVFLLVLMFIK